MAHWRIIVEDSKYLASWDLVGKDRILCIERIIKEEVKSDKTADCRVCYTTGNKPLILNVTNCKTLTKLFGTPDTELWTKKSFTVFPTTVRVAGEWVECIRIRPELPKLLAVILPELTIDHKNFEAVKSGLKDGKTTIEKLKLKYLITSEMEVELCK